MSLSDKKEIGTLYYEYGKDKKSMFYLYTVLVHHRLLGRIFHKALSEHFHTITVDLIGFGGTDKPNTADYTIKGQSKDLANSSLTSSEKELE